MPLASIADMKRVVMGIVDTPLQADRAVRLLGALGTLPKDVSILYPDRHGDHDFGFEAHTKAPEGALIGIGFGALLGAMIGLALGLGGVVPEVWLLGALGPILLALAFAAVAALGLGLAGALAGATVPEIEARYYEGKRTIGSILVAVHTRSIRERARATEVLASVIATDIHTMTEAPVPVGS